MIVFERGNRGAFNDIDGKIFGCCIMSMSRLLSTCIKRIFQRLQVCAFGLNAYNGWQVEKRRFK
jgi:hypothetical protein